MSNEEAKSERSTRMSQGDSGSVSNDLLSDRLRGYVDRALSAENRKPFDGDSNAPYRVVVEFAEVGPWGDDTAAFWCELKIPRQVDNELGMTIRESVSSRSDAARLLRLLADILDAG